MKLIMGQRNRFLTGDIDNLKAEGILKIPMDFLMFLWFHLISVLIRTYHPPKTLPPR